jgi:hypothetical protein
MNGNLLYTMNDGLSNSAAGISNSDAVYLLPDRLPWKIKEIKIQTVFPFMNAFLK